MNKEIIRIARKVATKQLPDDCSGDWFEFDNRVYKALRDMEIMRKLSGEAGIINDLMLLEFMQLGEEHRHVLRLSIIQLCDDNKLKRRQGQQVWVNLVTTVKYDIITQSLEADYQKKINSLLKSLPK